MAYEDIQVPISGQPASSSLFGYKVRDAILDLDRRLSIAEISQQKILGRAVRTTSKTNIGNTLVGILRLDNIPVLQGYMYRISSGSIAWDSLGGTTTGIGPIFQSQLQVEFSATYPCPPATTSSTPFNRTRGYISNFDVGPITTISDFYIPPNDGYISLLLSGYRFNTTGDTSLIQVYADANNPLMLTVEFSGEDPGTGSGVIL